MREEGKEYRKQGGEGGKEGVSYSSILGSLCDYRNILGPFGTWLTKIPRNRNVLFCSVFLFLQETDEPIED